jgi:hypothetical protein
VNDAQAGMLARELDLSLKKLGVPANALSVTRVSPDSMDIGTIVGVDVNSALHALGALGYIAIFGKCIYEFFGKHNVTIHVRTQKGSVDIPATDVNLETIEKILAELRGEPT